MLLPLIAFGGLATLALVATWRCHLLVAVGGAVAGKFVISNLAWMLQQRMDMIQFDERVVMLIAAEAMLAAFAFLARMAGGSRLMVLVVMAATLVCCSHLVILMFNAPTLDQRHSWNLVTNVCYAVECLLIISAGLIDRARERDRDRRPSRARLFVARDAYRGGQG